jgi:hypothetical protein
MTASKSIVLMAQSLLHASPASAQQAISRLTAAIGDLATIEMR